MLALVLGEGVFCGVLAGVGSNPAAPATDARLVRVSVGLAPKFNTAAAVAVLFEVRLPDARRVTESMPGIRFFSGDVGEVMLEAVLAER